MHILHTHWHPYTYGGSALEDFQSMEGSRVPKRNEAQPHRRAQANEYQAMYREAHREELNAYYRDYHAKRKADPTYQANRKRSLQTTRRKQKYGLTREAYEQMVQTQQGLCAICGEQPDHDLRVDHDHTTGNVRALLCSNCNTGLGLFREQPHILLAAVEYIQAHK